MFKWKDIARESSKQVWAYPLPGKVILFLWGIALIQGIMLSLRNYGFVHPDEVFQSLEIAHDIVYGVGIIPPEFQKNPYSSYNMSRSPLFPYVFVIIFWIGRAMGWDYWSQTLVLLKVVMGINSSLLLLAVYRFMNAIHGKKHSWEAVGSSVFVYFTWQIMYFSFRTLVNSFFSPLFFFGMAMYMEEMKRENRNDVKLGAWITVLTVLVYVRLDFAIILAVVLLSQIIQLFPRYWNDKERLTGIHVLSMILGVSIGGWLDYTYYNMYLVSPVHWYQFNIVEKQSSIFGVEPWEYYFTYLFGIPIVKYGLLFALILDLSDLIFFLKEVEKNKAKPRLFIESLNRVGLLAGALLAISIYSDIEHKEVRFIYNAFVLLVSYIGGSIAHGLYEGFFVRTPDNKKRSDDERENEREQGKNMKKTKSSDQKGKKSRRHELKKLVFQWHHQQWLGLGIIILMLLTMASWRQDAKEKEELSPFQDVVQGMMYVGQQDDARGVMVLVYWYLTGGYTYLHKDIPERSLMRLDQSVELYLFRFTLYNQSQQYNYVVIPWFQYFAYYNNSRWDLQQAGYVLVYSVTSTDVWRYGGNE